MSRVDYDEVTDEALRRLEVAGIMDDPVCIMRLAQALIDQAGTPVATQNRVADVLGILPLEMRR